VWVCLGRVEGIPQVVSLHTRVWSITGLSSLFLLMGCPEFSSELKKKIHLFRTYPQQHLTADKSASSSVKSLGCVSGPV